MKNLAIKNLASRGFPQFVLCVYADCNILNISWRQTVKLDFNIEEIWHMFQKLKNALKFYFDWEAGSFTERKVRQTLLC